MTDPDERPGLFAPPSAWRPAGPPGDVPVAATADRPPAPANLGPGASPTPPTRRTRTRARRPWGTAAALAAVALVAGLGGGVLGGRWADDGRPTEAGLPATVTGTSVRATGSVADVAAAVLPSVVSIEAATADGVGTGSGFVLRQDGYLLTNNHVVAGVADGGTLRVTFADGSQEPATIVGRTAAYDLAVIKVDRDGLVPLALGDSDALVVGDDVVAVGAPLGLAGTVTSGIVSALHRPVTAGDSTDTAFIDAIQTDAAINPGNSGGPLVNTAGEVVGINSAIAQPPGASSVSAGSIGLGFAIGSNQARRTATQLIETGGATYPVLGVRLDPTYTGQGVRVLPEAAPGQAPVSPDGPADRAGIRPGDVILSIDGRPMTEPDELVVAVRARTPGDAVTLRVRTGEQERDVRLVLDEADAG